MAHKTLLTFPATALIGDSNEQLEAGDAAALPDEFKDRPVLVFDDTAEMAAVSPEVVMPQGDGGYAGGTLKADIHFFTASANSDNVDFEAFVEAKTPNTDTLDLEAATSWDSANAATHALGGTAGDPRMVTVTLTNKDSVAAGDLVRFGIRRDADDGTNDTATGDVYVTTVEIWEDTG